MVKRQTLQRYCCLVSPWRFWTRRPTFQTWPPHLGHPRCSAVFLVFLVAVAIIEYSTTW